ncbi:MAG: hypothetical protein KAS07_06055 [Candidatus Pacebacteria bacterium]|nr:hypothetical protein [Candidatus Paceibacterota bacterium]
MNEITEKIEHLTAENFELKESISKINKKIYDNKKKIRKLEESKKILETDDEVQL